MTEPETTIDRRYSDPRAEATSWAVTEKVLQEAQLAWLTTVRSDGRPHVTPLVAVWLDGAIFFNTGTGEQKHLNLRANPNVVVTTGAATWNEGVDVVVEGVAEAVHDEPLLRRVADVYAAKWDGASWLFRVSDGHFLQDFGGVSEVFRVRPAKILAFAKGTFGQTRHRFR